MAAEDPFEEHKPGGSLSDPEGLQQIWQWNQNVPPSTGDQCVHELIVDAAQRWPDAPAVCAWNGLLTYGELDALSSRLAHHMIRMGLAVDSIVAICTEKSMWMPVAQLAVLKAGCAAILLDASLPTQRLQKVVEQVQPRQILASVKAGQLVATHLAGEGISVITLDATNDSSWRVPSTSDLLPAVSSSARLYIVMTSGSTGKPKAVVINHASCVAAIRYQRDFLDFRQSDRVFDFASYAFDNIWSNMMNTFTCGACLCIPSDDERKENVVGALHKYAVTYAHLTPSAAWFEASQLPSCFRVLLFGGEMLKLDQARRFLLSGIKVINSWGPAECTVTSSARFVQLNDQQDPSIGLGLGTCTWVVSINGGSLVPLGEVGELWLEGPIVGDGYLGDPEKTARAFVEDPSWLLRGAPGSSNQPGQPGRRGRLYRTGDLVRYNRDGELIFVGRGDSQVKIRGQRIELGEVEYHIKQALAAKDLAARVEALVDVLRAREDADGLTLVAYLYTAARPALPVATMKLAIEDAMTGLGGHLSKNLPPAMVPAAYIPIFDVPMTPTAKIDRLRMREIGQEILAHRREQESRPEAREEDSMSDMERKIRQVWSETLRIPTDRISLASNFVQLGGDSLKAMKMAARCRSRDIVTSVADILRSADLRKLAASCTDVTIRSQNIATNGQATWPLTAMQRLFLGDQRWKCNLESATNSDESNREQQISSLAVTIASPIPCDVLISAIGSVVDRHAMLRARFRKRQDQGGRWEQFVVPVGPQSFSVTKHVSPVDQCISDWPETKLDVENGPVFAVDVVSGQEQECNSFVMTAHRVVVDTWSWRIICHDIDRYISANDALPPPMPSFYEWCKTQDRTDDVALQGGAVWYWAASEQCHLAHEGYESSKNAPSATRTNIDKASTDLLLGASNHCLGTEAVEILVGTLAYCFCQSFGHRSLPVLHIEEERDRLSEGYETTVGPFTQLCSMDIQANADTSVVDMIRYVKDNRRHLLHQSQLATRETYLDLPQHGVTVGSRHGLFIHWSGALGRQEYATLQPQTPKGFSHRQSHCRVQDGPAQLTIVSIAVGEQSKLEICSTLDNPAHSPDDLKSWLQCFTNVLIDTTKTLAGSSRRLTRSEFPLIHVTYEGLEMLEEELESEDINLADVSDIFPCTPLQEGILLSKDMGSASYQNMWIWRCTPTPNTGSSISAVRLAASWEAVTKWHGVFSTVFTYHPETGHYIQIVLKRPNKANLCQASPGADPAKYLMDMPTTECAGWEPQCRFTICHTTDGSVACKLEMTHALIDPVSVELLLQSLKLGYAGEIMPPKARFRDVVATIQHESQCSRLKYWQNYLSGTRSCILPGDHGEGLCEKKYGSVYLPDDVGKMVTRVCRQHKTTRSVFLQLAWSLVLAGFTGMRQVCFGYASSGRDIHVDGVEEIIGPLVNVLIARIDVLQGFRDVLAAIKRYNIEHFDYQHVALGEIQRTMSTTRLFNTAVTVYDAGSDGGLTTDDEIRFTRIMKEDPNEYDAVLNAEAHADDIVIYVQYQTDFASRKTAEAISNALNTFISRICYALEACSNEYPRLDIGEKSE